MDKEDKVVFEKSVQETSQRIKELQLELEVSKELIAEEFYQSLTPGEIVECIGICTKNGVYLEGKPQPGRTWAPREYFELFPGLSPGETMLYLGWVDRPGEEIVITSDSGFEKVLRLTGPKWLIGDKTYVHAVPVGLLQPYEYEIEEEFAQNLGLDLDDFNDLEVNDLEEDDLEEDDLEESDND